jgi:hypothetical protein
MYFSGKNYRDFSALQISGNSVKNTITNHDQEAVRNRQKWFASGESNVFRLSREDVNGLS